MTFKEYKEAGGRYYQRIHIGDSLFKYVLKGIDHLGEPSEVFTQEAKDIMEGKALVLCPKVAYITQNMNGNPVTGNWGVRVIFPRVKEEEWKKHSDWGDTLRELKTEEILELEKIYDNKNK